MKASTDEYRRRMRDKPKPGHPLTPEGCRYWMNISWWRVGQVISLLFGFEPNSEDCGIWAYPTELKDRFNRIVTRVERGVQSGSLPVIWDDDEDKDDFTAALVIPQDFIKWAVKRDIEVPKPLLELGKLTGEQDTDPSRTSECRYLVKDFGTSQSPKSTRLRDNRCAPAALRSALDSTNTRRAQHRPQMA